MFHSTLFPKLNQETFFLKQPPFCAHYANFGVKTNFPQSPTPTSFFPFLIVTRHH